MRMRTSLRSITLSVATAFALAGTATGADQRVADAARDQNAALVKSLLSQRVDPNLAHGDGSTALHWAAHWDDLDTARALIAAGANADAATDQGLTPLALAAFNGSAPMIDLLLTAGANPNHTSAVGETPLMRAAHVGNVASVE